MGNLIEQNGYRYYSDEEMYKISMIKQFRRYGFSLEEIKSVLSKNDLQQSTTEHQIMVEKQITILNTSRKYVFRLQVTRGGVDRNHVTICALEKWSFVVDLDTMSRYRMCFT
ncbi:MerR family transcriptional regulator [Brevibacillus fortis]|uniref:MerR family transcriptional regulator n=1 Tax=Brevibacillus fortis TaxID=2126352 RepID=UPI0038FD310E